MAQDSVRNENPLYTGMIGMHGTKASNIAATKCDLFIAIGARFSDRVIGKPEHIQNARIVHIDVDPAEINKNVRVDAFVVGDAKSVLDKLIPKVEEKKHTEWVNKIDSLKVKPEIDKERLTPEFLFDSLNKLNDGNIIVSTEVGQHQMWAAQYFDFRKSRTFITSGGLGTMGFGLGAAIGAQVALSRFSSY